MTPAKFSALVLARLATLVAALVAAGWPALSPWWTETLARFMASGVRQLVARVGRRGGKSSTACTYAVAFALVYATLGLVPPGDIGWVVFVSVSLAEAGQRLRTIGKILTLVGVDHVVSDDTIVITGTNIGFRVQACTIASVSGWTTILVIADEVAKYRDAATGANPATEVLAALRPTLATQPLGRILLLSSPLASVDAHAAAFDAGDTSFQFTAFAETWIAHPSLTIEQCRALEPDERLFQREYAAKPQGSLIDAFTDDEIVATFRVRNDLEPLGPPVAVQDPSSGKTDAWSICLVQWCRPLVDPRSFYLWEDLVHPQSGKLISGGRRLCDAAGNPILNPSYATDTRPVLRFYRIGGWSAEQARATSAEGIVAQIAQNAYRNGTNVLLSDQRESFLLASACSRQNLRFVEHPWTTPAKTDAFAFLARHFRERTISIEPHAQMLSELRTFSIKTLPSGVETYGARGTAHDDYVALLMTASMGALNGEIPGGPMLPRRTGKRTEQTHFESSF